MLSRLPVYCILFLSTALAWLHLINWKYPLLDLLTFFSQEYHNQQIIPEWAVVSNQVTGSFLLVIGTSVMLRLRMIKPLMLALLILIILLAFADFFKKFPNVHELLEHGVRYATPLTLYLILQKETKPLLPILKTGIAATFVGHGIYALGIPAIPPNFMEMTMNITGFEQGDAIRFLWVVGVLDIMAGVGLFFQKSERIALAYCIIWGFLTALARVVAYQHLGFEEVFIRWVPEMILRLPNSLLPLWVLLTFYGGKKN